MSYAINLTYVDCFEAEHFLDGGLKSIVKLNVFCFLHNLKIWMSFLLFYGIIKEIESVGSIF